MSLYIAYRDGIRVLWVFQHFVVIAVSNRFLVIFQRFNAFERGVTVQYANYFHGEFVVHGLDDYVILCKRVRLGVNVCKLFDKWKESGVLYAVVCCLVQLGDVKSGKSFGEYLPTSFFFRPGKVT